MKKQQETKGCALILIIGLLAGMITGGLFGVNYASWKYAEIVNQGYVEIIKGDTGGLFVRHMGKLYKLETVEDHEGMKDTIDDIYTMLKEHEEKDAEEFEALHDKIEK